MSNHPKISLWMINKKTFFKGKFFT